jgi:O-antigen ligase
VDLGIVVGMVIVLFPPLTAADLYLSADRSGILPVNATVISALGLAPAFGSILLVGLARDRGRRLCAIFRAVGPPLLAFLLVTMVQLIGGFLRDAYWYDSGKYIFLPLYDLALLIFSLGIASTPSFRKYHRAIFCICLIGAAGSILVDVVYPQTFSALDTRPAGFMKDPNYGAATVIVLAIAAVDWTRGRASDMFLWLIAGTAIVATLSRGGVILLAITFLSYSVVIARLGLQLYAKRLSMLVAGVAIVVSVYSMAHFSSTVYSTDNQRTRMLAALLSGDAVTVAHDTRVQLLSGYIDLISDRPLLGYGTGFVTSRASQDDGPHNTYLALWVENGILGLVAYLLLLFMCFSYFRRLGDSRGQTFCISLMIFSFFSHDAIVMRPVVVTLGLLSVMAVFESTNRREHRLVAARRSAMLLHEWRSNAGPRLADSKRSLSP